MFLNRLMHMGKDNWKNPLLGDGATISFGGGQVREGETSNPGTADAVSGEVKAGSSQTPTSSASVKRTKPRCLRRGPRRGGS